jgi:hypothetical protein
MGCMIYGSSPGRGRRFIASPEHPDHLWGPPTLPFSEYWGALSLGFGGEREAAY